METRTLPRWIWPRAAYVHVPFCAHHCGYCDFAVATGAEALIDLYLEALAAELATLEQPQPVETLFLGGGTPTHLDADQLDRLLTLLDRWFPRQPLVEFTIEANPDTITDTKVAVLAAHGVNRVSLGVQSFQADLLRVLERTHDSASVPVAIERIRRHIPQLSLDLIFGVPGQTLASWDSDLRAALRFEPDHLSTYGLTFEKGTRLWKQQQHGAVQALDEGLERDLYLHGIDTLAAHGLEQYEISNFAHPGKHSQHNQVYWANEAYFGVGMGAAKYVQGRRELNTRTLQDYLRRALAGTPTVMQSEVLGPEERARETLALNLRRVSGVDREQFRRQTGFDLDALAGPAIRRHRELGLLDEDALGIRLTRSGRCVADSVICALL